jgi:alkylation response protein AidB-like acyl-CoA dehydrogenase
MSALESDELRLLRDSLRRFVEREMPREMAREWDRNDTFPREVFRKLTELGVTSLTVDEKYGGNGPNIVSTMLTIEELSKRSLAVAVPYIMCACYAGMNIGESGTPEQKDELLPKVASGELLFAYGLTEPDVGADLASVKTTARRDGDQVVVNGSKRFCTGANIADYIYCLVRTGAADQRHRNLSIVLIPTATPGVTITVTDSIGMKGAPTTDVTLDDVRVPFANVIGGENGWNNGWNMLVGTVLDVERLEVAATALGIAESAFADAWEYSQQRVQFGKPISGFQAIRHSFANMKTALYACRLMLYDAAARVDRDEPCGIESAMAKLFICERGKEIVLECQTIIGAYGLTKEFDIERNVRDMLILPIAGGSSNIQRNNIANMLGLAKG